MNLIENYIQPGYQIRKLSRQEVPFEYDGKGFVSFDGLVDCYGNIQKVHKIFAIEQWEDVKKQGYYLAQKIQLTKSKREGNTTMASNRLEDLRR